MTAKSEVFASNETNLTKLSSSDLKVAMNKDLDQYSYLNRHSKMGELNLGMRLTNELEKELDKKDKVVE